MTVWGALYVTAPCLAACYAMGLMHGSGFMTMTAGSSRARVHPSVGHRAHSASSGDESRDRMDPRTQNEREVA